MHNKSYAGLIPVIQIVDIFVYVGIIKDVRQFTGVFLIVKVPTHISCSGSLLYESKLSNVSIFL